jgi:hypothetical protein
VLLLLFLARLCRVDRSNRLLLFNLHCPRPAPARPNLNWVNGRLLFARVHNSR